MKIYHQVIINASIESVFKAITEKEGLSKWWLEDCTVKPELGFVNIFRYKGFPDNEMEIIDIQQNKKIEWKCLNSHEEWIGTNISFEVSNQNGMTKLDFKHSNWKEQSDFFGICSYHWARHLTILKDYCETGIFTLNPEKEKEEVRKVKVNK